MSRIAAVLQGFRRDDRGSAQTEWVVAVALVILMAVPVMAVIGDGSRGESEDIVVSIQDADSFGGSGFHGADGEVMAAGIHEEPFNPGVDLGVGFPVEGTELAGGGDSTTGGTEADRPRFYSQASGGARRDKPSARGQTGNGIGGFGIGRVASSGGNTQGADIVLPTGSNGRAVIGNNHCIVPTADVAGEGQIDEPEEVAIEQSGR
ncbi:MAG: hypothetical protein AAGE76_08520 [Pseudomonadota bacterium]